MSTTGAGGDGDSSQVLNHCKKLCSALQSNDKLARKQGLKDIQQYLVDANLSHAEYHDIFRNCHIQFVSLLRDKSEPIRELAIKFMHILLFDLLPFNDFYLSYLFPVLVERIGSVEIIEESEEIRLQLLQLIQEIIQKYPSPQLKPFLNDFITIFKESVQDKYPAIKETTCKCIILLAERLPKEFHMQAENLVKPVLTTFAHQRYKVRVEGIKCIGEIVMHSSYKAIEESATPMAERLFDQIPVVRQTVTKVTGRWLLEYRDRYSFFHKLLPLILTSLNDEVAETRNEAMQIWLKVGEQYQKENEDDLKDQLDFLYEMPKHYPASLKRPNLGCRVLVQRNVGKLTAALARELLDWQADIRVRCAQLLCAVAHHSEEYLTQHLHDLLMGMYAAAKDEDQRVIDNIVQATEIMAVFVPPDTWTKLLIPVIEGGAHYGHLMILAAFLRGSPLEYIESHLPEISKLLADPSTLYSRKMKYQREIIKCVQAIEEKHSENWPDDVEQHLFNVIVTMISIKDPENELINSTLLDDLQACLRLDSQYELWHKYARNLLNVIRKDPKSWTESTCDRCIFDTVLVMSREAFGEHLDLIGEISVAALDKDVEPEARLKTFMALSQALDCKDVVFRRASTNIDVFLKLLITNVFVPSLVWKAGRTAEALRTMSASCLCSALNPGIEVDIFHSKETLRPLVNELLPLLISLAEDAAYRSRHLAIEAIVLLKDNLHAKNDWEIDDLVKIYPEILRRLDDPTDKVRVCAIKAIKMILEDVPVEFTRVTYNAHIEMIIDTLITHYDDDQESFRSFVYDALTVVALINTDLLKEKIEKHKPIVRNKNGCDEVLKYMENLKL